MHVAKIIPRWECDWEWLTSLKHALLDIAF